MSILATALVPLCQVAERLLRERGTFIVPDILTNAGGLVASEFE